jgi:hypothetical protein
MSISCIWSMESSISGTQPDRLAKRQLQNSGCDERFRVAVESVKILGIHTKFAERYRVIIAPDVIRVECREGCSSKFRHVDRSPQVFVRLPGGYLP